MVWRPAPCFMFFTALSLIICACSLPQKGHLPEVNFPDSLISIKQKPSIAIEISFFPPAAGDEQKILEQQLKEELQFEFENTGFFKSVVFTSDSSDIHVSIVFTQAISVTSKQYGLFIATGGLSPVKVPCMYELQAEVHVCPNKMQKYVIQDEAARLVWAPAWPPFDWSIDSTSSAIRKNIYKTLILKMYNDGLVRPCIVNTTPLNKSPN